jgi:hypothetical protein
MPTTQGPLPASKEVVLEEEELEEWFPTKQSKYYHLRSSIGWANFCEDQI